MSDGAAGAPDGVGPHRRGTLRVYLGAAPGVGKTFAMLAEGRRRAERGTDVVAALVETHGRPRTAEQLIGLEVVPRHIIPYRGVTLDEMDVDAVLRRHPQVALVDELAHTNVAGCRNEKRWQDVHELLDAGIDVVTTLNIQHLESINDVVERITGVVQRETVPDAVVRAADQVELIDMTPEALRRRMAHGNIYGAEKIDAALGNYFRAGNLTALRELALLWVADQVDVGLEEYRRRHGITEPWETRERVVVAVTGAPAGEALIRRAARIARRSRGELLGLHVRSDDGLAGPPSGAIERHRALLEDMGGEFHEVRGADVASALVDFAHAENATQLVLGSTRRTRADELVRGSVINKVIRLSGAIDVHVISTARNGSAGPGLGPGTGRLRRWWVRWQLGRARRRSALTPRRLLAGWTLALAGIPLLTLFLAQLRGEVGLPTVLLCFLGLVVVASAVRGTAPAVVAAVVASLAANWYFTPPLYRWTIAEGENLVALGVFLGVALVVSTFVDIAARRAVESARARDQARNLARLAASMGEDDPLPILLDHVVSVFGMQSAAVLRQADGDWAIESHAGSPVPGSPAAADLTEPLAPGVVLALVGPGIAAEDQMVLNAFAAQLATVIEHGRLRVEAGHARALGEANALRTALLQAVSHDLRTPLAAIKASATSLADTEMVWSPEDTAQFVATINEQTDRLIGLVGNLLDMSRIQAGAVTPTLRAVGLEEVVPGVVAALGLPPDAVDIDLPPTVPPVVADPALLERSLANVIDNSARFAPPGRPVRVEAGAVGGVVDVRVVDRGPGIPEADRGRVFQPFQRLGDHPNGEGVGLGLAVAEGFVTTMGGTIEVDETPGGGATVVVTLPAAPEPSGPSPSPSWKS